MSTIKVSEAAAREIVKCWQANGQWGAVCHTVTDQRQPWFVHCRPIVASRNKLASNALWAGQAETAVRALVKFGLSSKEQRYRPQYGQLDRGWRRADESLRGRRK